MADSKMADSKMADSQHDEQQARTYDAADADDPADDPTCHNSRSRTESDKKKKTAE